jgi:diguanylate cyclase (GGDEF)-like protein
MQRLRIRFAVRRSFMNKNGSNKLASSWNGNAAHQRGMDAARSAAGAHLTQSGSDLTSSDASKSDDGEVPRIGRETAARRDAAAARRDETARRRDVRARALERSLSASDVPAAKKLAQVRARAAADRASAAADRGRAARDRSDAARERARLEARLDSSHLDDLTGAFRREMGNLALKHEIDRARRGDGRFVIAFVDVDGMKGINDRNGHATGDQVLRALVSTLRSNLRSFDPVVRYGGDEFVCGLGGADLVDVECRFDVIGRSLEKDVGVRISVGFAALVGGESLDELISRADAILLDAKDARRVAGAASRADDHGDLGLPIDRRPTPPAMHGTEPGPAKRWRR